MSTPGPPVTIERLIEEQSAPLYRYAYRLTGSSADAEDLVQDAFIKAQTKLDQLRDPRRAKPWLFSILYTEFCKDLRAKRAGICIPLDSVGDLPEPSPDPLPDISPEQLQAALNELQEGFRTPVILYYFEDISYRDIAEQMELPIGTVMSRLARAKAHLRARLSPQRETRVQGPLDGRIHDGL